ncbi:hypothetical protein P153DRAFT_372269 [Dothidotthia symphoricarpi CBS 119687]|uniref:Uncharacterized protein n=1 Tax=Dothidotthia symphoricarpi CBS 119687 TaxID=1392245 RepID=A0A6A6ASP4_9PLEO|nr:uncharacterized protein P153DRAFT_372269 [Dothidotthia symphoricarpi CBS 119687]KAF2135042.1 hypothetical protein P153DRAFT_372269 [Dothidotthia symphoricarpi CBS 119687]
MSAKNEQGRIDVTQKNVFEKPLLQHTSPRSQPSYIQDTTLKAGLCTEASPIAATLTSGFLDFAASRGVDLRGQGVEQGQRWCIGANRWKQALDSGIKDVPRVKLESTHVGALRVVGLDVLRGWAAEQDVGGGTAVPGRGKGWVRESGEIGGREPRA